MFRIWLAGQSKKEIVQIAALKVSSDFKVLAELNLLCKPIINPVLSDYFINLTGISNKDIAPKGISFPEAFMKFKKFAGNLNCFSHAWGASDKDKADWGTEWELPCFIAMALMSDIKNGIDPKTVIY